MTRHLLIIDHAVLRLCLSVLLAVVPLLSPPALAVVTASPDEVVGHHATCHHGSHLQAEGDRDGTVEHACPHCSGNAAKSECQCCAFAVSAIVATSDVSTHLHSQPSVYPGDFVRVFPAAPRQALYRPPIPFV